MSWGSAATPSVISLVRVSAESSNGVTAVAIPLMAECSGDMGQPPTATGSPLREASTATELRTGGYPCPIHSLSPCWSRFPQQLGRARALFPQRPARSQGRPDRHSDGRLRGGGTEEPSPRLYHGTARGAPMRILSEQNRLRVESTWRYESHAPQLPYCICAPPDTQQVHGHAEPGPYVDLLQARRSLFRDVGHVRHLLGRDRSLVYLRADEPADRAFGTQSIEFPFLTASSTCWPKWAPQRASSIAEIEPWYVMPQTSGGDIKLLGGPRCIFWGQASLVGTAGE
jgi:hypothetical protein